jgi:hypothetical protein
VGVSGRKLTGSLLLALCFLAPVSVANAFFHKKEELRKGEFVGKAIGSRNWHSETARSFFKELLAEKP